MPYNMVPKNSRNMEVSMASVFSSDVKITSNQQPKRLALDGGEYTYNEFKNHNRENLGEEKWKQVTELLISNLKVDENEKTHEPKDSDTKMNHLMCCVNSKLY